MSKVVLYILMRSDMASLNPGKMCAQASHAANQCIYQAKNIIAGQQSANTISSELENMVNEWEHETNLGFGTCIVLGVNASQLYNFIQIACESDLHAAITHDPSYPLLDGAFCHHLPMDTCGYIFCHQEDAGFLSSLNLLP